MEDVMISSRRKNFISIRFALFLFCLLTALFFSGNLIAASLREDICLNGEWQFIGTTSNETGAIPSTGYGTVRVPGSWYYRPLNYTDTNYTSYHKGWYKLPLNIPARWSGKRIKIYFERVNHFAMVFINNKKVGEGHQESFTPFEVDITTFVTLGQQNTLHVYNEDSWRSAIDSNGNETPGQKPALISDGIYMAEYNGYTVPVGDYMSRNSNVYSGVWTGFGDLEKGIWGNVYLRTYNPVFVEDAYIVTSVRQNKKITTRLYLRNDDSTSHTVNVINTVVKDGVDKLTVGDSVQLVTNPDMPTQSKTATTLPITIPARSNVCIEVSKSPWDTNWADPGGPKLWGIGKSKVKNGSSYDYIDYGDPILYFLKTSLTEGGQTVDTKYTRFGFKELWVYNPEDTTDTYSYPNGKYPYHYYLNGKRVFFQATCLDHAHESSTWNRQNIVVLYRSEIGRNMNFIRLHCYSPSQVWFDVADELGVFVVPEVHLRNNSNCPSLYCQATNSYTSPYGTLTQSQGITNATAKWTNNLKYFFREYVRAHRNHPSIANWSNGNEIFQTMDGAWQRQVMRHGRTKAYVDIVNEAVRLVDPTRKVSSSGRTDYLKISNGTCYIDTNLYGNESYDFADARKVFLYEAPERMEAPYNADQAFNGWATKYKRPVMDSEEELDRVPSEKIDPALSAGDYTEVQAGYTDWANFFYINPTPSTRFTYRATKYANTTYTNIGNCIARAAYYQIPRFNVFSVPIRSPWLRPSNQETVFGLGSMSPNIQWPSMSGEGTKAKQLIGGSSRTTYNWFDPTKALYNTNFLFDRIRDGWANCPPYAAIPKFYEAGAGWYTDTAFVNGLTRLPEVIVTLKDNGVVVPDEYVIIEPINTSKSNPVGVMTDKTGKAWFTLKEAGDYRIVYYANTGTNNVAITKTIPYTLYKDWTMGGYNYIDQTVILDKKDMVAGDTTAPAAIANLETGNPTLNSITLTWTAVGDDGTTGTAASYDIRYMAGTPITSSNFASATPVIGEPAPKANGGSETMTVNGLTEDTQYYFAIKAIDEVGNQGNISNVPNARTLAPIPDTTAPAVINNLTTGAITYNSVVLTWTAVGDDGTTGTATSYDMRYSNVSITDSNWGSATPVTGEPAPKANGESETMAVNGLNGSTQYYFAIKVIDESSNQSGISNVVNVTTPEQPADIIAPAQINNLSAGNAQETSITLTWTAVGDDGTTGTATGYDIRYSNTQITDASFASATSVTGEPTPKANGGNETMVINGLTANTQYYFAIKAGDEIPNWGPISNIVGMKTLSKAMAGEWKFEENTGTTVADTSGNSNNGTLSGTTLPVWETNGKIGKALKFDGNGGYVSVADKSSIDITNAITLEAGVKSEVVDQDGSTRRVIDKGATYALGASDKAYFKLYLDGIATEALKTWSSSDANVWHHLVGTYDGTAMKLYQDGVNVANTSASGLISTNDNGLQIGRQSDTSGRFKGLINEVRIYNRALTNVEIQNHFNPPPPPVDNPPTINITAPANNSVVSEVVAIEGTATDDNGISKVCFYMNNVLKSTDTTAPYTYSLDTTQYTNGTHIIKAIATDTIAQTAVAQITVTVNNVIPPVDNPPTINITAPTNNSVVSGIVTISGTANDAEGGVTSVAFYIDNILKNTDTTAPFAYSLDTTQYTNGT